MFLLAIVQSTAHGGAGAEQCSQAAPDAGGGEARRGDANLPSLPRPGPSGVPCGTRDGPPSPCQSPLNLERWRTRKWAEKKMEESRGKGTFIWGKSKQPTKKNTHMIWLHPFQRKRKKNRRFREWDDTCWLMRGVYKEAKMRKWGQIVSIVQLMGRRYAVRNSTAPGRQTDPNHRDPMLKTAPFWNRQWY